MSFLDRVSRLMLGSAEGAHDAVAALSRSYADCLTRARQLSIHAEMAPQPYGAEGLRDLATAEEAQAQRLREALHAAGAPIATVAAVALPPGALNHWSRLVQDLETHRLSMRRLRELAIQFAEELPSTAQLFEALCHEENAHCEALRTLIARADPQALN